MSTVVGQPAQTRWQMRSASMMTVTLVTVEGTSGMIEAPLTRRFEAFRILPEHARAYCLGHVSSPLGAAFAEGRDR